MYMVLGLWAGLVEWVKAVSFSCTHAEGCYDVESAECARGVDSWYLGAAAEPSGGADDSLVTAVVPGL